MEQNSTSKEDDMAISLKKWLTDDLFSAFMNEYNENMEAIEGWSEPIGKLLRFRANVTVTKSTFSSSTGFHYQQLAVDIPAGYTGNTSAQWAQVQILSSGIWLISPISVTTTKVHFYIVMGVAWDYSASPPTYPASVAVSIV